MSVRLGSLLLAGALTLSTASLPAQTRGVSHGVRPARFVIRNATIVDGNRRAVRWTFTSKAIASLAWCPPIPSPVAAAATTVVRTRR